ncbi:MAG: hypothetical protein NVS2B16_02150 [Chloroflexota bacterium]
MIGWQSKSDSPPAGYTYGPRYRPSVPNVVRGFFYFLRGKPRSLSHDTSLLLWNMPSAPLVRGLDNIPEDGPFVLAANHYERPRMWMVWPAVFIGHCVRLRTGRDTRWIAIEEWDSFEIAGIHVSRDLIRTVFQRVFRTWGILPMPRPDSSAAARARAIRVATQEIKDGHVIGLMPEGDVGPTPELLEAREGAGTFLLLMASAGARVLPVAIYEEAGRMVSHFGHPFRLILPEELPKADRDRWARDRVMCAIKDLLPEPLWGFYGAMRAMPAIDEEEATPVTR